MRPSAQYTQYEKDCAAFLKSLGINQPVNVAAKFYMPTKRRVDLTNLNEALHDILVKYGVLVDDNTKIIVSTDGSRVFVIRHPHAQKLSLLQLNLLLSKEEAWMNNPGFLKIMIFAHNPAYAPVMVEPYSISPLLSPISESMAVSLQVVKPMASGHVQEIRNH